MHPDPTNVATKERLAALLCVVVVVFGAILALVMYTIGAESLGSP